LLQKIKAFFIFSPTSPEKLHFLPFLRNIPQKVSYFASLGCYYYVAGIHIDFSGEMEKSLKSQNKLSHQLWLFTPFIPAI
jgi:hypothetical protein